MKMKNLVNNWSRIGLALILGSLIVIVSCGDDEEPEENFADPTIAITSPTELSGLQVLVASPISFTLLVEAEAGLSSVSLDGSNVKIYSQGETTDTFDYEFTPGVNGTNNLVFVVEDSRGITTDSETVAVEAVGDPGFLLADFGGADGSSVALSSIDPDHWDADRVITNFVVNGSLTASATHENVNNQFSVEMGMANPDSEAILEYQGKTMKVVKQPAPWGTAGWSHIMFDFGTNMDKSMVEALPQLNAEQTGLTTGTKFIELDVYYDDSSIPFGDMVGETPTVGEDFPFGSDRTKGYSFFLMLTNHAAHRLNPDGDGMFIGYEEYLTEANVWTTIRFDELYLESVGNFFGSGNEQAATSDVIDGVKIVAGGGYGDGQSSNAIYFRNLRIVDAD
ncbi:MAG: hypothetical protein ACJA08_002772 [Cyclobacteriaceae bacterium]|jgi:hypothetical protein